MAGGPLERDSSQPSPAQRQKALAVFLIGIGFPIFGAFGWYLWLLYGPKRRGRSLHMSEFYLDSDKLILVAAMMAVGAGLCVLGFVLLSRQDRREAMARLLAERARRRKMSRGALETNRPDTASRRGGDSLRDP